MDKMTIRDIDLKGKKVLMRADFNVPLDESLNITDDIRIRAAVPTMKYILDKGAAKLILMSHLGRPKGKPEAKYSLQPVAERLNKLLNMPVKKLNDCVKVKAEVDAAKEKVILLENLRFHAEEEANDPAFAKELAGLADIFVNDAFGTAHRAHASTEGVTKYLPSVAGFLLEKEIEYLIGALDKPKKPFVIILGGAKISDKIGVIENLLPKADCIIIGGGMAYTFLVALGKNVGSSKLEPDKVNIAKKILDDARTKNVNIALPVDHVASDRFDASAEPHVIDSEDIPEGLMALDIGPKTIEKFKAALKGAKTVVWNGPLGVSEWDSFKKGTEEIANLIAALGATTIIGGGDTAAAIAKFKLEDKMTHISTGGGASLELMEGKILPGIAALKDKK
ncbi:MAG: phosphoglycerate kinase [Candidatus Omnitrophica bacterium]|nr:phosphoglycerate kinase [Candidatus Omnitrophota bacterium]